VQTVIDDDVDLAEVLARKSLKETSVGLISDGDLDAIGFETFAFGINVDADDFSVGEVIPPHPHRCIALHANFDHPLDPVPRGPEHVVVSSEVVVPPFGGTKLFSEFRKTKIARLIDAVVFVRRGVECQAFLGDPGGFFLDQAPCFLGAP
jgi:hypothetical protein